MRPTMRLIIFCCLVFSTGCSEGLLWRTGQYSPWVQNQWAKEEAIANTIFTRKQRMTESVADVLNASLDQQQVVAAELAEVLYRDSVLLMRLHAVHLLAQLDCPAAQDALENASRDNHTDIRLAAVKAWSGKSNDVAIPQLMDLIGSDTNVDVRLAATRALGNFSGSQAVQALSLALEDNDPAMQLRAMESLKKATGESLGTDVSVWKEYVARFARQSEAPSRLH